MEKPYNLNIPPVVAPPVQDTANEQERGVTVPTVIAPPVQDTANEQERGVTVPTVIAPPVQDTANEQERGVTVPTVIAPPVQPADNEQEDTFTIPLVDLKDAPAAEDEKDLDIGIPVVFASPVQPTENEKLVDIKIPIVFANPVKETDNDPLQKLIIPLDGKLLTAEDPFIIGKNFRTLVNMRYGTKSPKSIGGMTKINATYDLDTYLKVRNAHHFRKIQPAETTVVETHILAQAWNTGLTAATVIQNETAPPAAGEFTGSAGSTPATALWTDTDTTSDPISGLGTFSDAPGGQVAYCNGVDTCLWGGNGIPISAFLNFDSSRTFMYDFTDVVSNSKDTEVATFTADTGGGGAGSDAVLLLHFDNNVTDAMGKTVINNNVTFQTTQKKFGTHATDFDGATAYLTVPDDPDFDFSDGTWTIDFWYRSYVSAKVNPIYYQETPVTKVVFTGGSHAVVAGNTVTQTTSGATGTILSVGDLTGGSWAGGNAAGPLWIGSVTGTWGNGNTMIETTDQLNSRGLFTGSATGWTLGAGWTYDSNNILKGSGTGTAADATFAAVIGESYSVIYTISDWSVAGNRGLKVTCGGTDGTTRSADGTYTDVLTAVSTGGLIFTPTGTDATNVGCHLDSITVKIVPLTCTTCTTDVNYFLLKVTSDPAGGSSSADGITVSLRAYGTTTDIISITQDLFNSEIIYNHIEVSENGNDWYIFFNGNVMKTTSSASRAENYTSIVYIGKNNNDSTYFLGQLDELRVGNTCRHTASFYVPTSAYASVGGSGSIGNIYIMTPRPAKGFKFYIKVANTQAAATASVSVWNGAVFTAVASLSDGTANTGTLKQNGSITFATTVGTAKVRYMEGRLAYCYQFSFSGISATTSVYHVTADCPFQSIVDLWDGIDRLISQFYLYKGAYQDFTTNVYENRYGSTDSSTYVEIDSLTATTQFMEIGFLERMTAIDFTLVPTKVNTTAGTTAAIYYWSGAAYVSVGAVVDGSAASAISLAGSGVMSWDAPAESAEQKKVVNNGIPQYFYKVVFNQTLSADVQLCQVIGIPAQKTVRGYKFPLFGQGRLLLCNNVDKDRNAVYYSADGTAQVFNGADSGKLYFGDNADLTCGCNIFSQLAQNLYSITIFFKDREVWGLVQGTDGWQKYRISDTIGCNCPKTLKVAVIPPVAEDKSGNRNVAIWMRSSDGVYVSDGRHPILVSYDIRDLFGQNSATHINLSYAQNASAWVDQDKLEYHLCFAVTTGTLTANDVEWVLDLRKWAWYPVDRGAAKDIQCGINVTGSYGENYTYGFIDTGYMERLEYGNTFDGNSIISIFQTGDFPLIEGDYLTETRARKFIQSMVAKITTTADVKLTHYVDTQEEILTLDVAAGTPWVVNDTITGVTSGSKCEIVRITSTTVFAIRNRTGDFTLGEVLSNGTYAADQGDSFPTVTGPVDYSCDPTSSGYRVAFPVKDANSLPGIFHSIKEVVTISNETVGFEPLVLGIYYEPVREHLV